MDKIEGEIKQLTLDYSKWICGEGGEHQLGEGSVSLLNKEGYMCCLGQWSLQLGATEKQIFNNGEPNEVNMLLPGLTIMIEEDDEPPSAKNTIFSDRAMTINDDQKTTPEQKIESLSALCAENGFELIVTNNTL